MLNSLQLFQSIIADLLKDEEKNPVAKHIPADELYQTLDLHLQEQPLSPEAFETCLKELVFATPRTATNAFFNQLFGGRNAQAILGDLIAVLLNNSMYTYKAAGAMVGVEKTILREVCNLIGWDENSNGTFATGGSMTNFMSMLMARDKANPKYRFEGGLVKMTVYTSKESHYSIPKNAAFCGIGRDNVRFIDTNSLGQIDVEQLAQTIEADIANGYQPVLVNATAGTTVLGEFDPIHLLADLCEKHNIWLHIDGAYCGSVIFSKQYRHLIDGVERADSFSFNAHKMLGTPLTCSLILVKDKSHLYDSFANDAEYLYQTDHDDFNLGKTSLQCGRRNDALKFWTLWKSVGTEGLEKIVDKQFALTHVALDYIKNNPDYTVFSKENSISVCFNYKDIPAKTLCTRLYEEAKLLVGYGSFKEDQFVRLVTINAQNQPEDILNFFHTLEKFVTENELLVQK